jgi:hypothetical protein
MSRWMLTKSEIGAAHDGQACATANLNAANDNIGMDGFIKPQCSRLLELHDTRTRL